MKIVVWGLVLLLLIVRQDIWLWSDATLVFGFLPIGLAYQMGISIGAAFTWFLATKYAWPLDDSVDNLEIGRTPVTPGGEAEGGAA